LGDSNPNLGDKININGEVRKMDISDEELKKMVDELKQKAKVKAISAFCAGILLGVAVITSIVALAFWFA